MREATGVATDEDLRSHQFQSCMVSARRLNIDHADPFGRGPFCRLVVEDTAPGSPGVYAWSATGVVMYVGKARTLRHIVNGAHMGRAYNDYTYIPLSQCQRPSDPRVRINGLLNGALCDGSEIGWWWVQTGSEEAAFRTERQLIVKWAPPWNRL